MVTLKTDYSVALTLNAYTCTSHLVDGVVSLDIRDIIEDTTVKYELRQDEIGDLIAYLTHVRDNPKV